MVTVLDSLLSVSAYPIPLRTLVGAVESRGLNPTAEATQEVMQSDRYKLAKADVLMWLSLAPDVSQGGQSYSFSDDQRVQLRNRANALYGECEDNTDKPKPTYGYKGNRL